MWEVRVNAVDGDHHLEEFTTYTGAWLFACEWLGAKMKWGRMEEVSEFGDELYILGEGDKGTQPE